MHAPLCARAPRAFRAALAARYYACTLQEHILPVPCANSKITQAIFFIRRHRSSRIIAPLTKIPPALETGNLLSASLLSECKICA